MEQHLGKMVTWTNATTAAEHQAQCSCGWKSPTSESHKETQLAHREHVRAGEDADRWAEGYSEGYEVGSETAREEA